MLIQNNQGQYAHWYISNKSNNKIILFAPGFPKYPQQSQYITMLLDYGYDVLAPMYSGTFESHGKFSIENSVKNLHLRYQYILRGNFINDIIKNLVIQKQYNDFYLFGVSYGALISNILVKSYTLKKLKKVFLVSILKPHYSDTSVNIAHDQKLIVQYAFPKTYRFENIDYFFEQIINQKPIHIEYHANNPEITKIIIHGYDDQTTPKIYAEDTYNEDIGNSYIHIISGGHSSKISKAELSNLLSNYL